MDLVERVWTLMIAYQAGDLEQMRDAVRDDVRLEPLSTRLEPGPVYEGWQGVVDWFRELAEDEGDFQPAVENVEVHDRRVLVTGCVNSVSDEGRLQATEAAWVFAFDAEGRLEWMRAYRDRAAARETAAT